MDRRPQFLVTDPAHFDVRYQINPWMRPAAWRADPEGLKARAAAAADRLQELLELHGAQTLVIEAAPGLPDLVFPANAAVVLDGRVLLARFRHPERQGEEAVFRRIFSRLKRQGIVQALFELPPGLFQEGAGDAIWDSGRGLFWTGFGPRSSPEAASVIGQVFGRPVQPLELASERFYHLDTCFCPLTGGEVLYYPPAFTSEALDAIRAIVPEAERIEASDEEAVAFCVNAVNIGRRIIMARAPASLRSRLRARGYELAEVDLGPFILSGGGAYCMTLRLDRTSLSPTTAFAAE
jgi:N-dimethylarginine dimethylaminohydrolase